MFNTVLNRITNYFMMRAYTQMQQLMADGEVDYNEDTVSEYCEDYYTHFVSDRTQ
jgi:hypothetical protein